MAAPDFPVTFGPDWGGSLKVTPKVLRAEFGDGYQQRAGHGINTQKKMYNVVFTNVPEADADTLDDFFEARNGTEAFNWTGPRQSASSLYICKSWQRTWIDVDTDTISAEFEEVFSE